MTTKRKTFSKAFRPSDGRHDYRTDICRETFALLHAAASEWAEQNGFSIPKLAWCNHQLKGLNTYHLYVDVPEDFEGDLSEVKLD